MISSFIVRMYKKISDLVRNAYSSSTLKVINDKTVSAAVSASHKSYICSFLSSESKTNVFYNNSLIAYIVAKISSFFKFCAAKSLPLFEKSCIFSFFSYISKNALNIPLNLPGIFILMFSVAASTRMLFDTLPLLSVVLIISAFVFGLFMIFTRASVNRMLFSSKISRCILRVLTGNLISAACFDKPVIQFRAKHYILTAVFGALAGIASYFVSDIIILALIAGSFGISFIIRDFRIGAYMVMFLFPFIPTMAIVGILLLSLISLVIRMAFDNKFVFSGTGLDLYIILFSVIICISGFTSFDRSTSINIALVYIVFIFSYFVFSNTLTDRKSLNMAFIALLAGGIIVSLYGIYQYVFGFSEGNIWIDTGMFTGIETRVVSTFENPNVLGEYLLIIIPVMIAYFFEHDSIRGKWTSALAACILILCMIFTFSRGCWIGLIVSVGVMCVFYDRRFVWLGFILLLLSPLYLPESIIQRFLSVGNTSDTSTSYRVYIWFGTIDMLKDYWLTGIGLGEGAFNVIYPHYSYSAIVAPHSHNLYLQILVENGITGFIVFVCMIIAFYRISISTLTRLDRGFMKVSLLALVSAVTGYLIQGLFDNVWYNYRVFMFFFMTLAITVKCANIAIDSYGKDRGDAND